MKIVELNNPSTVWHQLLNLEIFLV